MTTLALPPRPSVLPPHPEGIPDELKEMPTWCLWKMEIRQDKDGTFRWTKCPYQTNGTRASSTDPATWTSFQNAIGTYSRLSSWLGKPGCRIGFDGVGFVFTSGIVGIDLDHCLTEGVFEPWAQEIVEQLQTYTEISPSGTGAKLWCRGELPTSKTGQRKGPIEVYARGRYFTCTGHHWPGTPREVRAANGELTALWQRVFGDEAKPKSKAKKRRSAQAKVGERFLPSDQDIFAKAEEADNGDKFRRLVAGDNGGYNSESEADAALAMLLAFWSEDPAQIERMMRSSKLARPKWDEPRADGTWLQEEIAKAMEMIGERYDWHHKPTTGSDADAEVFGNVTIERGDDDEEIIIPKSMNEIIASLNAQTDCELKRVMQALFVHSEGDAVDWIASPAGLFGWLHSRCGAVRWKRGEMLVGKDEFFSELRRTAPHFESVESLPHFPRIASHYYTCADVVPGDTGCLDQFLRYFCLETDIDQELLRAAVATPLWGGPPGARPCFMFTAMGRGRGKSKLAHFIAQLFGGALDFDHSEDVSDIKKRLLSPGAATSRIAMLDNLKSLRFSWGALEGLITSPRISGKAMYLGEHSRPNHLTWLLTLNGASLSTDMAQRVVEIRLRDPAYSGDWEGTVRAFIEEHRAEILAGLASFLTAPKKPLQAPTRWAIWENEIVARLEHPDACLHTISERRGQVDAEVEEAELIQDYFRTQLARLDYDPDTADVFVPSRIAAEWYGRATNTSGVKVTGASTALKQLSREGRLPRICEKRTSGERGFRWIGEHADIGESTAYDLTKRLTEKSQQKNSLG